MMLLPPPHLAQVFLDFDGTLTQRDLLDDLIAGYSRDDSWKQIERLWEAGEIGSRRCLEEQFALVNINDAELEMVLDRVSLDPGAGPLIRLLERANVPGAVLSDGIDLFITRTLSRQGLSIPIRANTIQRRGATMNLLCPLTRDDCKSAAAHCKCGSMQSLRDSQRRTIYVGDGRSDLCPARTADFVFAKGALARALEKEGRPFARFTTLVDVKDTLEKQWQNA
jgi:2-hydroxy-3-keto-5-methylthiopentenyl-1-phosphate phosphatase